MPDFTLETDHGVICITDTGLKNDAPAILLIHGNSSSSKIFRHMFESPNLTSKYRLITFDLPGHGASSNAPNPGRSYTMSGYADLAVHILSHLNIRSVVVFGWSLGGHIALEMVDKLERLRRADEGGNKGARESGKGGIELKGLILTGTPPSLGLDQVVKAFKIPIDIKQGEGEENLMAKVHWTYEQAERIARSSAPGGHAQLFEQWMLDDAIRTDGRARMVMFDAFVGGRGVDQVGVVEGSEVSIAVINGSEEPFVDLEYVDGLEWGKLWKGECVKMEGLKHTPFWEDPVGFERLLLEFLGDCEKEG
jgi:pimeloyl-ACP methyl ester carboxylesterase